MKYEELPDVLTVQDLQKYLRVGKDKAYQVGKEIPHFKNGNRMMFPKERVREWLLRKSATKVEKRLRAVK